jgi:uncharacterized membrane protein HdeD (DUF308 family)
LLFLEERRDLVEMQSSMSAPMQIARRYWGMSLVRGIVAIIFGLLAIFWPHLTFRLFMLVFGIFAIVEGIILLGNAFTQRTVYTPAPDFGRRVDPAARANAPYTAPAENTERSQYRANAPYTAPAENTERSQYGYGAQPRAQDQRNVTGFVTHRANRSTLMLEGFLSIICGILALILPNTIGSLALYAVAAWAAFKGIGSLMQMGTRGWVLGVIGVLGVILALIVLFNPLAIIHSLLWIVGVFSLIMGIMLVGRALTTRSLMSRATRPMEPSY